VTKMEGVDVLVRKLQGLAAKSRKNAEASIRVGFNAPYALIVHEDLTAHHTNGVAKFLEIPLRQNRAKYAAIVTRMIKNHRSWQEALLAGGQALLVDSQSLCPVDTGFLRDSGYAMVTP
jgi:hypothetical protein